MRDVPLQKLYYIDNLLSEKNPDLFGSPHKYLKSSQILDIWKNFPCAEVES